MSEDAHNQNFSGADDLPPSGGKGAASGLQPGGTTPGGQPGATEGSIGTGGGSTAGQASGNPAKRERKGGAATEVEHEGEAP